VTLFLQDFKKIIDSAVDGAVVVSFGSVANSSTMPDTWKQAFLDTFAAFPKIKFIFKYEAKDLQSVPSNTLIAPWMPQFDLLGSVIYAIFFMNATVV
jgi:glucuronosyltransferase